MVRRVSTAVVILCTLAWSTVAFGQGRARDHERRRDRMHAPDRHSADQAPPSDRGPRPDMQPGKHSGMQQGRRPGMQKGMRPGMQPGMRGAGRGEHPPPGRRRFHMAGRTLVSRFEPRQGPPGTQVTIWGHGLDGDVQVTFGDRPVPAGRVTRNARSISFKVPPQAQSGLIVLRRKGMPNLIVGTFEVGKHRGPRADRERERRQWRKQAQAQWKQRRKHLASTEAARLAAVRQQEQQLQQTRDQRRRQRLAALRSKWNQQFLARPEVADEVSLHADRTARLARMLRLAEAKENADLVVRIQVMQRTEDARHEQRMNDLKSAYGRQKKGAVQ